MLEGVGGQEERKKKKKKKKKKEKRGRGFLRWKNASPSFLTELPVRPHDAQALPVLAAERQREGDVDSTLGEGGRAAGRLQGRSALGPRRGQARRCRRQKGGRGGGAQSCPPRSRRPLFSAGRGRRRAGARLALLLLLLLRLILRLILLLSRGRSRGRRRRRKRRRRRRRSRRAKCCLLLLLLLMLARGGTRLRRSRSASGAYLTFSASLLLRHEGLFSL